MKQEWWYPEIVDKEYLQQLREDYPESAEMDDEELHDYYCEGRKYSVEWDNVGEAYDEYEKLADAFLELVKKLENK